MPLLAFRRVAMRLAGAAAVLFFVLPASAADPSKLIDTVAAEVIEIVKTKTGADRQAAIRKVLQANFDLPYMARSALGTHWNQATEEQRARFLKASRRRRPAPTASGSASMTARPSAVGKVTARPNGVTVVDSKLNQATGQPIKLEWEVRDNGQGPRITDVKVEGVSMVMTRRSDFNSYIQNNGGKVEPLIQELEARAKR